MYSLLFDTPQAWTDAVLADFDAFLLDHAAAEKKASGMAISMLSHYPDRPSLVTAMVDLSIEEMTHFREVVKLIYQRGLRLGADSKDLYVNQLRDQMRSPKQQFFLDRLLVGSIIESRGCERFGLIAKALPTGDLKQLYIAITESEKRHEDLFLRLAYEYFDEAEITPRLNDLLQIEANICKALPIRSALH